MHFFAKSNERLGPARSRETREGTRHFGVRVFVANKIIRAIRGFDRLAPVLYILRTQLRAPPHGIGELCQCAGGL